VEDGGAFTVSLRNGTSDGEREHGEQGGKRDGETPHL
jgi:hypothetical protein